MNPVRTQDPLDPRLASHLLRRVPPPSALPGSHAAHPRSLRRIVLDLEATIADGLSELDRAIEEAMGPGPDATLPARVGSSYALSRLLADARAVAAGCSRELRS